MGTRLTGTSWWFDLRGVNAYLVEDGETLTLVDAGTPLARSGIVAGVEEAGHSVDEIDRVLLTHYDLDHVGALGRLPGLDAPAYIGAADARYLTGEHRPPWRNRKGAFQRVSGAFVPRPRLPIRPVTDGDAVGSFTAYHTPGHTPGHVAYVSEELGIGFLGDLVTESDGTFKPSPRLLSYDAGRVRTSIESLAERSPAYDVAAMGHGVPFLEDGSERLKALAASL